MRGWVFLSFQNSNIPCVHTISPRMKRIKFRETQFCEVIMACSEFFGQSPVRIQWIKKSLYFTDTE